MQILICLLHCVIGANYLTDYLHEIRWEGNQPLESKLYDSKTLEKLTIEDQKLISEWKRSNDNSESLYQTSLPLAESNTLPDEFRKYFILQKASAAKNSSKPLEWFKTLDSIKQQYPDDMNLIFNCDLDQGSFLGQCSDEIQGMKVDFSFKKAFFDRIFASYTPYHHGIIDMHMECARFLLSKADQDPLLASYVDTAIQHLNEAGRIIEAIRKVPALVEDKTTLSLLGSIDITLNEYKEFAKREKEQISARVADQANHLSNEVIRQTDSDLSKDAMTQVNSLRDVPKTDTPANGKHDSIIEGDSKTPIIFYQVLCLFLIIISIFFVGYLFYKWYIRKKFC